MDYFCCFGSAGGLLCHFILGGMFFTVKMVGSAAVASVFVAVLSYCLCCQALVPENLIAVWRKLQAVFFIDLIYFFVRLRETNLLFCVS